MKKAKKPKPLDYRKLGVYGPVSVRLIDGKGRGLVAEKNIKKEEIILINPAIQLLASDAAILSQTILKNYIFCGMNDDDVLLALGPISLCNHAGKKRNCDTRMTDSIIVLSARRDIAKGEELTIDYGYNPTEEEGEDDGDDDWEP